MTETPLKTRLQSHVLVPLLAFNLIIICDMKISDLCSHKGGSLTLSVKQNKVCKIV